MRLRLDQQLKKWPKSAAAYKTPERGWIFAVRKALGMTTKQLAWRLGISQAAATGIMQSEASATIQINTLRRVASAMNCTLVYAIIPNEPLEKMLAERRLSKAGYAMHPSLRTLDPAVYRELLDSAAQKLPLHQVWDEFG